MSNAAVTAHIARPRTDEGATARDRLPHWSDVAPRPSRFQGEDPSITAAALADLVSWAADIGIKLTHGCPEDRAAIEEVRDYTRAWLAGMPRRDLRIQDVLVTVATLLSAVDLDLGRTTRSERRAARGSRGPSAAIGSRATLSLVAA